MTGRSEDVMQPGYTADLHDLMQLGYLREGRLMAFWRSQQQILRAMGHSRGRVGRSLTWRRGDY